ncbi:aspartate aminotransferase family protein [Allostella sp. ATCC 35155]|nr:aspartate aminotransferase family protein [Stella sp. ATCC 35155]
MSSIPEKGRPWAELKGELEASKADDYSWRDGRMAVYYYFLDDELMRVQQEAYTAFWTENNLGQRAFPSLKKLEDEVVAMALDLLKAPPSAGAAFTSGGSESIFLAVLAARNKARAERGIERPTIVLPRTAHPTFDRAAHYLGVRVVRVPTTRNDLRADVGAIERALTPDTVMIVGSAPNYPFGVFDPIAELGRLAERHGLWLHVDACVGGFLAPWVRKLGYDIPPFEFDVPGVSSMSADLHKYGMTAKGASLMLVRDKAWQKYHSFEFDNWERGKYAAMTTQGSRPGGAVAAAWAVMNYLGADGYLRVARQIMTTKEQLVAGITAIPGLAVVEPHELCIFVYHSVDPNLAIGAVADAMGRRGWLVGRQSEPPGIHLALNPNHDRIVEPYLADLRASVEEARGVAPEAAAAAERTY